MAVLLSTEKYPLTTKVTLKVIRYFFGKKISVDRCLLKLVLHFCLLLMYMYRYLFMY